MDAKDEVKERLSVEDVVGDYIELKRSGRNFKGLSPWTNEKTASLMVSPDKQIWHDFSSGKGGDIFSFVMAMEGMDFREALENLARKAGVDLPEYGSGDKKYKQLKERVIEANELAIKYYHQSLLKNKPALEYVVKQRGFGKEVVGDFTIGYAPSGGDGLKAFLLKKGFDEDLLHNAGLIFRSRGRSGDMFRGRIMIPLRSPQGEALGFTSRIIEDNPDAPKYLNTPKSPVYDKSRHVFGLELAREHIRSADFAIVAEGNLDVVASHQAGVKNCVATAGTAMTTLHLKQIKRFTSNIRLAFDGDKAGIAATERAVELAQEVEGLRLEIIELPNGADPDDIVRDNPDAWKQLVDRSHYVLDWLFEHYDSQFALDSADGKKQMTDHVLPVLKRLRDPVEQEHYLKKLADMVGVSLETVVRKMSVATKTPKKRSKKPVTLDPTEVRKDKALVYQDTYLGLNVVYPGSRDSLNGIDKDMLVGDARQAVFAAVLEAGSSFSSEKLPQELHPLEDYVKILSLRAEELYADWADSDRMVEAIGLARRVIQENTKRKKTELTQQIAAAESAGEDEAARELLAKYHDLLKE